MSSSKNIKSKNRNKNGNGNKDSIKRRLYETNESYSRRVWFVKQYKGTGGLTEGVRLANIWINMILLHCRYPEKLEKIIHSQLNKMNGVNKNK